jgi:hypothetical protein
VAALQNPIVAALQKELASVTEKKERLDARKARLEELIVEFTGNEEEGQEDW